MDKEHLEAATELKQILSSITSEICHVNNVDMARLTFPYNTISYGVTEEIWKPLEHSNYSKNKYIVSSWGRVFNVIDGYYLSSHLADNGYVRVAIELNLKLNRPYKSTTVSIHRLVGLTFLMDEYDETINHIDLDKRNNFIDNLEFISNIENLKHAYNNGAHINNNGWKYFCKEEINDIKSRFNNGESITKISKIYNKGHRSISDIVNNKTYNDDFWDNLGFSSEQVKYYKSK